LGVVGFHQFPGCIWAEVLEGCGYRFHRPCPAWPGEAAEALGEIEAKPKGRKEPRLKDAIHTLQEYLACKPEAEVYEWPPRAYGASGRLLTHSPRGYAADGFDELENLDEFDDGGEGDCA